MRKLTLKKEIVSSLSNQTMSRIVGGGESEQQSGMSTAPCRCDSGETDGSQAACITNELAGCSMDCGTTLNCGGSGAGGDDQDHASK